MKPEEIEHLLELRAEYEKRRRILEKQVARFGSACPTHILVELEEVKEHVNHIDRNLDLSGVSMFQDVDVKQLNSGANNDPNNKALVKYWINQAFNQLLQNINSLEDGNNQSSNEKINDGTDIFVLNLDSETDIHKKVEELISHIKSSEQYVCDKISDDQDLYQLSKFVLIQKEKHNIKIYLDFSIDNDLCSFLLQIPDYVLDGKHTDFIYSLILRLNGMVVEGGFGVLSSGDIIFRHTNPITSLTITRLDKILDLIIQVYIVLIPFITKYTDRTLVRALLKDEFY